MREAEMLESSVVDRDGQRVGRQKLREAERQLARARILPDMADHRAQLGRDAASRERDACGPQDTEAGASRRTSPSIQCLLTVAYTAIE